MRKIWVAIMGCVMLFMACNKETPVSNVIPALPPDQTIPTLDFPFASFASTTRFVAFGDTLANKTINAGYQVQLADTNENILAACTGFVTAITPDTAGGNFIAVKFKQNNVYSFLYGGVTNVKVHANDSINAGTILGKICGSGVVYFQLIKNNNTALCPQTYGSPGFNTAIGEAIAKHNSFHPTDSVLTPCAVQAVGD